MEQTEIRVKELTQEPEWAFGILKSKSGMWYFNGSPGDYRELGIDPPEGLKPCNECGGLFPSWNENTIRCPSCSVKPLVSPSTPVDEIIGSCKYCEGDVYSDDEYASEGFCSAICRHKHALPSKSKAVNSPPPSKGNNRADHSPRSCKVCGKTFIPLTSLNLTCSTECSRKLNNSRKRPYNKRIQEPKQCEQCGKTFTPTRKDSRYCSKACKTEGYKPRPVAPTPRPPKQVATPTPAPVATKQPAFVLVAIDASYDEAITKAMELGLSEVEARGVRIKIEEVPNTGG